MKEPSTVTKGKTPPTGPLTAGERRGVLIAVVVMVAVLTIGATIWTIVSNRSNSLPTVETCVTVAMASSMGGGVEHACGKAAHDWCLAAYAQRDMHAQAVQLQCRRAGIVP